MKKRNWFIIFEYITITASVLGSIAAFLTKEIVFATAPLTLSLILNLKNRNSAYIRQQNIENSLQLLTQEKQLLDNKIIQLIDFQEKLEIEQNTKNQTIEQSLINLQNIINDYVQKIESIPIQTKSNLLESEDLINQSQLIEIKANITRLEKTFIDVQDNTKQQIESTDMTIISQEIQNIKNTIAKIPLFMQPLEQRLNQLEITYSTNVDPERYIDDFQDLLRQGSVFLDKLNKMINLEINSLEKDLFEIDKYLKDAMSAFQILEQKYQNISNQNKND